MFKNAIVAILAPILLSFNAFAATLPDYKKEAKLVIEVSCDTVIVIETASEGYYLVGNTDGVFVFLKRGGALTEMQHDPWDEDLFKNAPNAFMAVHGLPSDCVEKNK